MITCSFDPFPIMCFKMYRHLLLPLLIFFVGCSGPALRLSSADEVFTVSATDHAALVTAVIAAAGDVGLPPRSRDGSNPDVLTFGGYGVAVMGYAAKATVSGNSQVAASIHLYSYDQNLNVDMKLADFKAAIRRRLSNRERGW